MIINLNKCSLFLFVFFVCLSGIHAQNKKEQIRYEEKRRLYETNRAAMEKSFIDYPQAKDLRDVLMSATTSQDCSQAIYPFVEQNERRIIPYLKTHLELYNVCKSEINVALVRMGEDEYYQRILSELKSDVPVVRVKAIEKLSLLKSKESYRKLYELLDDTSGGKSGSDYIVRQMNYYVMDRLLRTVENPPTGPTRYDPAVWKAWFEKNKHLIE